MKKITLALSLFIASGASAITCETDSECLSEGIKLIKQARKVDACDAESKIVAKSIESAAAPSQEMVNLEKCVAVAKKQERVNRKHAKRLERIQKSLN